jgi:hypothetical protein
VKDPMYPVPLCYKLSASFHSLVRGNGGVVQPSPAIAQASMKGQRGRDGLINLPSDQNSSKRHG